MKKIIAAFTFVLISFSTQSSPQTGFFSGVHDSLLFDGANSFFINAGNDCRVKVSNVSGIATGTRCIMKTMSECGKSYEGEVCEKGQIFPGDKLKPGEEISTGQNGYLTIMLSDGKTIRFGHNTKIVINSNYCENNFKTQVLLEEGELYINAKPNKDIKGLNVTTDYGTALIEGTEFSYSSIKEGDIVTDILKVYEGSVKFQKNMQNKSTHKKTEDKSAEMTKLVEDFQNGKITAEEYTIKFQALQNELTETFPHDAETVNEGFQSKVVGTDNATVPEPFDMNENRWWEVK